MNKTKIEWIKNPDGTQGYSWNPITGCLNGCSYCYARKLANGRLKSRYLANTNVAYKGSFHDLAVSPILTDPFYPREWFDRRERELESKNPKGVFVCDMSDLFGIGIPESWTECVLETIKVCPDHRFYLLTKQPQNLIKWSPFPENVWLGVTAVNSQYARKAMTELDFIDAKVKYLSIEPLQDSEGFTPWKYLDFKKVNWVIIGAQTKPTVMPKIEWVRDIVDVADKARIPVFLKNSLRDFIYGEYGGKYKQIFKYAQDGSRELRQEFPEVSLRGLV